MIRDEVSSVNLLKDYFINKGIYASGMKGGNERCGKRTGKCDIEYSGNLCEK